jgi:SIT4-associating protein SAP185/190
VLTGQMVQFIQSIPNVIPRLMAQIHSPAIQDILTRLVSAEESGVSGVITWLSEERFVYRLICLLSPQQPPHIHVLATELLKNIITLCAPPPFNLGGNMQEQQSAQGATSGTRDNRMVRELVNEASIRQLVGYMLDPLELSDANWPGLNADGIPHPADPFVVHPLPSSASAASSLCHISTIFVELIRRNNSDFAEPHLFHTLRNRLMNMRMEQGAPLGHMEEGDAEAQDRERMEDAVKGMSESMGIVHLRSLLDILCERFDRLNTLLKEPRTQVRFPTCQGKELMGRNTLRPLLVHGP